MNKLNLGCGFDKKEGWVNLDFDKDVKPDVLFNLEDISSGKKMPFKDNFFDYIYCVDVIEHLSNTLDVLRELYRICKVGGIIEIKVPYGDWTFVNLDHKRMFFLGSFDAKNFDYLNKDEGVKIKRIYKKIYYIKGGNILKNAYYSFFMFIINNLIKISDAFYDQTPLRYLVVKTNLHVKFRKVN